MSAIPYRIYNWSKSVFI